MSKQYNEPFIEPWVETQGWNMKDFNKVKTPSYVVSLEKLEENLKILNQVEIETGCKILLAMKGFSMFSTFPLIRKYLSGSEASSVNEARLGFEEFKKEVHTFSPSYTDNNIKDYIKYSDHLIFNSFSQWNRFKKIIVASSATRRKGGRISCGIRVNLEHSESEIEMYDPSRPNSQFGVTRANFEEYNLDGIDGLHFHNLCELNADALERSLKVFEEKFGKLLDKMKWVNFGGGHHITRKDYDLELLKKIINGFRAKYTHLDVYLEPGEAVALNTGVLVGSVIDVLKNGKNIAVLDISPTCHMPDVLEIPYIPTILEAQANPKEGDENAYQLVGPSCLTGDVIGDYTFKEKLKVGDRVIFMNMAIYTMVKNNTFNGINLPNIALMDKKGKIKIVKKFGYKDFKSRLS
jgi:carboxynorspermidine decarboxylase